jgi:hypothetical protein
MRYATPAPDSAQATQIRQHNSDARGNNNVIGAACFIGSGKLLAGTKEAISRRAGKRLRN